jgi:hypothetical protein
MLTYFSSGLVNDHIHQVLCGTLHEVFSICTLCGTFGNYVLMRDKVICVHAVKANKESRVTVPFPWPQHWIEVNGQLHTQAALPLGEEPLVTIE